METFEQHQGRLRVRDAIVQHGLQYGPADSQRAAVLRPVRSREIIAERTRDKIAATARARASGREVGRCWASTWTSARVAGCWSTPTRPNASRAIFALYLEHERAAAGGAGAGAARGWANKCWRTRKGGRGRGGGRPFTKTGLHRLLTNVTYVGRARYRDEVHPGEQPPLVDAGAFQRVGQVLAHNGPTLGPPALNRPGALLKGLLHCGPCGSTMTPKCTRPCGGRGAIATTPA